MNSSIDWRGQRRNMAPCQKAARIVQSLSGQSGIRRTDRGEDLKGELVALANDLIKGWEWGWSRKRGRKETQMATLQTSVGGKRYCPILEQLVLVSRRIFIFHKMPFKLNFLPSLSASLSLPILNHPGWSSHSSDHFALLCLFSVCYVGPFLPLAEILSILRRQRGYLVHGASLFTPVGIMSLFSVFL